MTRSAEGKNVARHDAVAACDHAQHMIATGQVRAGCEQLVKDLFVIRNGMDSSSWRALVPQLRDHPVRQLLWQDPFTKRAFDKPRGYPGDAPLLDFAYRHSHNGMNVSDIGHKIFECTVETPEFSAVRERRRIITDELNCLAQAGSGSRVLSVACGHLREVEGVQDLQHDSIEMLVAIDADQDSLAEVNRCYGNYPIHTAHASVRSLLGRRLSFDNFDLIYAAGLFDYLADRTASQLIRVLWTMLRPGGRILIANFAPSPPSVGYMETFMDWWLIYRSHDDLQRLVEADDLPNLAKRQIWPDCGEHILYLDIQKR